MCISANLSSSANWPKEIPPRGQLRCHGHDPGRATLSLWLEGKLMFPVPNALSQGDQGKSFMSLLTTAPTCSPSACPLLSWLSGNTMSNHSLRAGTFQKGLQTVNQLQIAFRIGFKMLQSSASNSSWVLHSQPSHVLKYSKCQIMSVPFWAAGWKESSHAVPH